MKKILLDLKQDVDTLAIWAYFSNKALDNLKELHQAESDRDLIGELKTNAINFHSQQLNHLLQFSWRWKMKSSIFKNEAFEENFLRSSMHAVYLFRGFFSHFFYDIDVFLTQLSSYQDTLNQGIKLFQKITLSELDQQDDTPGLGKKRLAFFLALFLDKQDAFTFLERLHLFPKETRSKQKEAYSYFSRPAALSHYVTDSCEILFFMEIISYLNKKPIRELPAVLPDLGFPIFKKHQKKKLYQPEKARFKNQFALFAVYWLEQLMEGQILFARYGLEGGTEVKNYPLSICMRTADIRYWEDEYIYYKNQHLEFKLLGQGFDQVVFRISLQELISLTYCCLENKKDANCFLQKALGNLLAKHMAMIQILNGELKIEIEALDKHFYAPAILKIYRDRSGIHPDYLKQVLNVIYQIPIKANDLIPRRIQIPKKLFTQQKGIGVFQDIQFSPSKIKLREDFYKSKDVKQQKSLDLVYLQDQVLSRIAADLIAESKKSDLAWNYMLSSDKLVSVATLMTENYTHIFNFDLIKGEQPINVLVRMRISDIQVFCQVLSNPQFLPLAQRFFANELKDKKPFGIKEMLLMQNKMFQEGLDFLKHSFMFEAAQFKFLPELKKNYPQSNYFSFSKLFDLAADESQKKAHYAILRGLRHAALHGHLPDHAFHKGIKMFRSAFNIYVKKALEQRVFRKKILFSKIRNSEE